MKKGKNSFKWKIILIVLAIIIAGIYYYIALPAINIHNQGFLGLYYWIRSVGNYFTGCKRKTA